VGVVGTGLWLGFVARLRQARSASEMATCNGNLCYIGGFLLAYHEKYGHFPPAYTVDKDGRPMHSWRALLLEFANPSDKRYDFNEPWNGPNNIKLANEPPSCLICPSDHDMRNPSTSFTS
jgi:hypothetical protein